MVTGDALDNIVVWDYEARKIVYRTSAVVGGVSILFHFQQLFNDTVELITECVKNPEIPPVNRYPILSESGSPPVHPMRL